MPTMCGYSLVELGIGPVVEHPGPRAHKKPTMSATTLRELAGIVDGLDEDHHDYREVRAAKRLIHDLLKDAEDHT